MFDSDTSTSGLYRTSSLPLTSIDLNPPTKRGEGLEYLAGSNKSRKARALGMVKNIGRALSLTKPKSTIMTTENPRNYTNHQPIRAYPGTRPQLLKNKTRLAGPTMTPLKGDVVSDRIAKKSRHPMPLRSRRDSRTASHVIGYPHADVSSNPLYHSEWNHSRHALSVFDVPLSAAPQKSIGCEMVQTKYERQQSRPSTADPRLTRSVLDQRYLNTPSDLFNSEHLDQGRQDAKYSTMTPHKHAQHRSARKAVPSTFLNDSFESLINSATTYGSQRGDYEPLHVISTPGRLNTSRSGIEPEGHGAKSTPPTPDFGGSILPQPLFSSSANDPLPVLVPEAGEDKTFDHSVDSYDLEAETSFDRRQNDLYDEVLTSWDLPPLSLSRSNSLVLGKITDPTHLKRNLSKSTGLLESRPALPPQIASSILHSPASSSYPIRAVPSQNRLGDAHVDVESRELGRRGKRKLSDKVKKAVEALEGQHMDREATESPPTPWKRMASLLQPKSSESSLSLREETKRMMCEAREKRSRMRLQKQ